MNDMFSFYIYIMHLIFFTECSETVRQYSKAFRLPFQPKEELGS